MGGPAEGDVDGEEGVVLSLGEVGDVVAVDVEDDEVDGENEPRPSQIIYSDKRT